MAAKLITILILTVQCIWATNVFVKDLKLFVNCEEYFIKGMAYAPTPIGYINDGGFCSIKQTAWGEEISACYDRDYFDGSMANPLRDPAGPSKGWFVPLWERDFPAMKELGVNTLRLYSANPTTKQSSQRDIGMNGIVGPYGKDHTQFMAMAGEYGFKIIFPLIADYTVLSNNNDDVIHQYLMNQIDEVGNSSALLMWVMGNELPLQQAGLVDRLNGLMDFARNYTNAKWGRTIPVTISVADDPTTYENLMATLKVDVFSSNAGFRGNTFQDLWSGSATYAGFNELTQTYKKPLFISEIGWRDTAPMDADFFNQIYSDLIHHYDQGTVGGAFYEWNDQTYKAGETPLVPMGIVYFEAAVDANGDNSTEPNVWLADTLVKKPIFETLKSGTYQGIAYNYNSNPFTLVGRAPITLSTQTCAPDTTATSTSSVTTSSDVATSSGTVTTAKSTTGSTTGTKGTTSSSTSSMSSTSSSTGKTSTTSTSGSTATSESATTTSESSGSEPNEASTTGSDNNQNLESSAVVVKMTGLLIVLLCIAFL